MSKDTRSRKWLVTINNPLEKGFTHEYIIEQLERFSSIKYYCFSDEVGLKKHTPHTHIFFVLESASRFSTVQNRFPKSKIFMCKGTSEEVRNYVFKLGSKYEKNGKCDTNLPDSHVEFGECPVERKGYRNDLADLQDMINCGMSNVDIIQDNPNFSFRLKDIDTLRMTLLSEKFKNTYREIEVHYICGPSRSGKTRSVYDKYGYNGLYRITDYKHPFDTYNFEDVIVFDEFHSSLSITQMLTLLEGYPMVLPCRFYNRPACYTKVYIISNIDLDKQYLECQRLDKATFKAFLKRFSDVTFFDEFGSNTISIDDYISSYERGVVPVSNTVIPFQTRFR